MKAVPIWERTRSLAGRELLRCLWPLLALPLAPLLEFVSAVNLGRVVEAWAVVLTLILVAASAKGSALLLRKPKTALLALGTGCSVLLSCSVLSPHQPPTGDEPAYLVMASSLIRDGDLELFDDYRDEAWRAFGVSAYRPFLDRGRDGKLYPHHGPGMGLLLAPFVAIFDAIRPAVGLDAALALLRILPGLALGLFLGIAWQLAVEWGADPLHALGAAAAAGLSVPALFYSTQLYPDVPGGMLLALLALERPHAIAAAVSLLLLPQLGVKFVPPMVLLGAALLFRMLRGGRRGAALAAAVGLTSGLAAFFLARPLVNVEDYLTAQAGARIALLPWWIYGYLADQRTGLLGLAPIYFVAAAGIRHVAGRRAAPALVAAASYVGIYAYHLSWGGLCPPGRPLIAVLWLAIVLVALGLRSAPAGSVKALAVYSGLVSAAYLLDHRSLFLHLRPNAQGERSPLLGAWSLPELDLTRLAPFVSVDDTTTLPNLAGLLLLSLVAYRCSRPGTERSRARLGSLAAVGALAAMLLWASKIDPTRRLPSLSTSGRDVTLHTDAGAEWTDGWLPGERWVSCWIRGPGTVRLRLQSLVATPLELRGRGLRRRLELGPGAPAEIELSVPGGLERIELRAPTAVVPAEVTRSQDRRPLGVRISVSE